MILLALVGGLLGGRVGRGLAVAAVGAVIGIPIARVIWLIGRWHHEDDTKFVVAGIALLVTIGAGAVLAALGVG